MEECSEAQGSYISCLRGGEAWSLVFEVEVEFESDEKGDVCDIGGGAQEWVCGFVEVLDMGGGVWVMNERVEQGDDGVVEWAVVEFGVGGFAGGIEGV